MARPTKYTDDTIPQTLHYLANYDSEEVGDAMPSVAGLAVFLGVSRSSIYEWADDPEKAQFSDILETLLAKQEQVLFNRALRGDFNASIAKLALGKHGYSDKQDNTHSGPNGGPIEQVQRIERKIVRASDNTSNTDS